VIKQDSHNLDVLRSVAVLLVLFSHFLVAFGLDKQPAFALWGIESLGKFGVQLFFIHTSLVLMMSLARLEKSGGGAIVGRFYIRRIFRIFPLSMLTIATVLLLKIPPYFGVPFTWPSPLRLWSNLLLIQNLTRTHEISLPLWSLPFELQMYVILPFIYFAGKKFGKPLYIVMLGFVLWQGDHVLSQKLGYPRLLLYAPFFFLGMATFYRSAKNTLSGAWFVLSLLLLIVLHSLSARVVGDYRAGWPEWVFCLIFCMMLPSFYDVKSTALRHAAKYIAKYSYSIYLAHLPLMWWVFTKMATQPMVVRMLIFWVALAAISVVLYHAIEEPFIRLGGLVANSLSRRPQTPKRATTVTKADAMESVP